MNYLSAPPNRARSCGLRYAGVRCFLFPTLPVLLSACLGTGNIAWAADSPFLFTDVTLDAGIDFVHTIGDEAMDNIVESSGVGCALLDYDGDGWLDIFFVNGVHLEGLSDPRAADRDRLARASDRLYRNLGNGRFQDVTVEAGIEPGGYGMGVLAVDYDNDGRCDLYVTNYGPNRLYRNLGGGRFRECAAEEGLADSLFSIGATALDFDGDGDLDLYVGNYLDFDPSLRATNTPFPGPDAYRGQPNRLYRNDRGRFQDATSGSGLEHVLGRTMGVSSFDHDDDRRIDLFVANDAMENYLFRNLGGGRFEETALLSGVAYAANGEVTGAMGAEWGDLDGDGRLDLFVPDYSNTCLYRNAGSGLFEDSSRRAGIASVCNKYVSWGAVLADFDLNTHLDLYVATGDAFELKGYPDLVFANDGTGQFTDVSAGSGRSFATQRVSRGVVGGDLDNDGDIDLIVVHLNDRPTILRNDTPRRGRHWLSLKLIGNSQSRQGSESAPDESLPALPTTSRDPIGTRVLCTTAGETPRTQIRELRSNGSYASSHDQRVHFGLGAADIATRIVVQWPDGSQQILQNVRANQTLTVRQR